jgi:hypothetical protein
LAVLNTLYTVTEIFEFAARVAKQGRSGSATEISVELHGMKDRTLALEDMFRNISVLGGSRHRMSSLDVITHRVELPVTNLLSNTSEDALNAAIAIYERFGWLNPSRQILAEDQKKFLERRLGV